MNDLDPLRLFAAQIRDVLLNILREIGGVRGEAEILLPTFTLLGIINTVPLRLSLLLLVF